MLGEWSTRPLIIGVALVTKKILKNRTTVNDLLKYWKRSLGVPLACLNPASSKALRVPADAWQPRLDTRDLLVP